MPKRRDTRKEIIEAVYNVITTVGVENTTMRKISAEAHTTENVIYNYFTSKVELLEVAFTELNSEVDAALRYDYGEKFADKPCNNVAEMAAYAWRAYLEFWVSHTERTIFYDRYIHSALATEEIWVKQSASFAFFTQIFYGAISGIVATHSMEGFRVLLTIIIESALTLAKNSIKKGIPITEETKVAVCNMIKKIIG